MAHARPGDWQTPRNTWLIIRRGNMLVAQINGPVLELMTDSRTRFDRRLAMLGPDILAPELNEAGILRRLREDDPTRPIGDSLLDQRILAGIGNLWKVEGCFDARDRPVAAHGRRVRRGGAPDPPRRPARGCSSPPATGCRSASRSSTAPSARTARAAASCQRSGPAGKATTTATHTGVHDVSAETDRTQGRRPHRPREHARVVRRRARPRRGHDRVRRARAPGPAAARPRLRAHRGRADARGGPRPPREQRRSTGSSSTWTSSSRATRSAPSTRCASTGSWSARSSRRCGCGR